MSRQPPLAFADPDNAYRPLADRMRPRTLDECLGQPHLLAPGNVLREAIEQGHLHSMVFWGPPGTGKTTLARLIAQYVEAEFISLSAILAGVKDIRAAVERARVLRESEDRGTVLFVDEVHRFNKSQQDAFLPFIEDGTICFIGATTENPSFELNNALLSRLRVYVLKSLQPDDIIDLMQRALHDEARGMGRLQLAVENGILRTLAELADGDARRALNLLEIGADLSETDNGRRRLTGEVIGDITSQSLRRFDKGGDEFYEQISALHKSVRGSDPDAALYWCCRMLDGGCDPLYIARRAVRMASEDIGNADPRGLGLALQAWETFERLGSPEGELAIGQALVYLASAPKSNAVYTAFGEAMQAAKSHGTREVPVHLRNAPTRLMKELGYGERYRYSHDDPDAFSDGQRYFPEGVPETEFYRPVPRGLEIRIGERLAELRRRRAKARSRRK